MALSFGNEARPDGAVPNLMPVGEQVTGFEEPDIVYLKLVGAVTDDEVRVLNEMHHDFCRDRDRVFFLVDMSELETLSNSVRKATIEALNRLPLRGLSIYKAPLTARVLAKLIITGMKLFGKNIPLHFADDEAGARAWIGQLRKA